MQPEFVLKRAERKQARLRLALAGASNGGKTRSSLIVAQGIVEELIDRGELTGTVEGKVGIVDTEHKSAQLESHLYPFDVVELDPPYSTERYLGAMRAIERAGRQVLIIDSLSHAWAGAGGVLEILDKFQDSQRFSAFGKAVNPEQNKLIDAILGSSCHVIVTMRAKTAWTLEQRAGRDGRQVMVPRRIGMAPVQRPGVEYEFTTLLNLDADSHFATVVKNRCPVFDEWTPQRLTQAHGRALAAWMLEGAPMKVEVDGSPLERAQAVRDGALRLLQGCKNAPDLARVGAKAKEDLKAFRETVDQEVLGAMLGEIVEEYGRMRIELGADPRPAAPPTEDPPPPSTGREVAETMRGRAQQQRSVFDDMKDDIPF